LIKKKINEKMMMKVLYFYENYMLPRDMNISRPSLLELKR